MHFVFASNIWLKFAIFISIRQAFQAFKVPLAVWLVQLRGWAAWALLALNGHSLLYSAMRSIVASG